MTGSIPVKVVSSLPSPSDQTCPLITEKPDLLPPDVLQFKSHRINQEAFLPQMWNLNRIKPPRPNSHFTGNIKGKGTS